jgi:hypothetical protein
MNVMMISKPSSWHNRDDKWQKRQFILTSLVRLNIKLSSAVYEFVDSLIDNDTQFPLDDLNNVDKEIFKLYEIYKNQHL